MSARARPLLVAALIAALLCASVRVHHEARAAADDHEREQRELCTEPAAEPGHHDHDAPGAPCDSPLSHCGAHGCAGHHATSPASAPGGPPRAAPVDVVRDERAAPPERAGARIDHPPKAS